MSCTMEQTKHSMNLTYRYVLYVVVARRGGGGMVVNEVTVFQSDFRQRLFVQPLYFWMLLCIQRNCRFLKLIFCFFLFQFFSSCWTLSFSSAAICSPTLLVDASLHSKDWCLLVFWFELFLLRQLQFVHPLYLWMLLCRSKTDWIQPSLTFWLYCAILELLTIYSVL